MVSLKCETWLCEFASLFCDIASSYFCAWSINLFQLLSFENGISGHQPKNLKAKQLTSMGNWVLVFSLKKKKKMSHLSAAFSFPRKKIRRIPVPFLSLILASLGAVIFISLVLGFWNFKLICLSASLFHPL